MLKKILVKLLITTSFAAQVTTSYCQYQRVAIRLKGIKTYFSVDTTDHAIKFGFVDDSTQAPVSKEKEALRCEQFNPAKNLKLPRACYNSLIINKEKTLASKDSSFTFWSELHQCNQLRLKLKNNSKEITDQDDELYKLLYHY